MEEKHKCRETIYDRDLRGVAFPCPAAGKIERDGKWYCGIHDPVAIAERAAKREAKRKSVEAAKPKPRMTQAEAALRLVEAMQEHGCSFDRAFGICERAPFPSSWGKTLACSFGSKEWCVALIWQPPIYKGTDLVAAWQAYDALSEGEP